MTANIPNFFIIGAPKCGTTSLAAWLAEHPNIYMSPVKEPHFFNTDLKYINTSSLREYKRLFSGVLGSHKAIGEASVFYLYSKDAVPRIERELPGARYIVMVRNPVDMAYSLHEQQVFSGNEHVKDFGEAWRLCEERARGRSVTRWCREPALLAYNRVCCLGEQIERLLSIVQRERVLILVLDDIKENARREYLRVLEFLGAPDDGRQNFAAHNTAKERRWPWLRRGFQAINAIKRSFHIPRVGTGLMKKLDEVNMKSRQRTPMLNEIRIQLATYFRQDVLLLSEILERDLSHWLELKNAALHPAMGSSSLIK